MKPLLEIKNLHLVFHTFRGDLKALYGVNLKIYPGEVLALVGESGSGKTITALSILRLLDPTAEITNGEILFNGRDILKLPYDELVKIRGKEISMIFQEPRSALNPVMKIGDQLIEALTAHTDISLDNAKEQAIKLLKRVGLPDPERIMSSYPHELSGGMAQRVMIAMALLLKPKLLIADEPTTALDVTIQAQILDLLRELVREYGLSVLFITHNLAVAAEIADRIAVMYAGLVVEVGDVHTIFRKPKHPYTIGLLKSIPRIGLEGELYSMEGEIPSLAEMPDGCHFHPRCPYKMDVCTREIPPLVNLDERHEVSCWLYAR